MAQETRRKRIKEPKWLYVWLSEEDKGLVVEVNKVVDPERKDIKIGGAVTVKDTDNTYQGEVLFLTTSDDYGVVSEFCCNHERQLEQKLTTSSASAFLRQLVDLYFKREVLAVSSFRGKGEHIALDEDITAAIITATIKKFPECRRHLCFSSIIDNKCTKARQYLKKKMSAARFVPER